MDKESEERMAPALHSADHEAASPLLTNTKYSSCSPPSSISQPEADDFTQVAYYIICNPLCHIDLCVQSYNFIAN